MLTGQSRVRDWALFLAIALLPALALGAIGLRALGNEEAAVRRELSRELEAAASSVGERYRRELDRLAEQPAVFADRVVLSAEGQLEEPAAAGPKISAADETRCRALETKLAAEGPSPALAERILSECERAATAGGQHLWPVVALDPRVRAPAARLQAWLARHAGAMSRSERAVTRLELRQADWLAPRDREALAARIGNGADAPGIESYLISRRLSVTSGAGEIRWREAGSLGELVRRTDGRYGGAVVHPSSIARALESGWPDLQEDLSARLILDTVAPAGPSVELLPKGAYLVIGWKNPELVAVRAQRSRAFLFAAAGGAGLLAVALATLLFARMRAERRSSALRTDFVAAVSHELRTPIASMRMLSELLAEGRVDPSERDEVQRALVREAERLGVTVNRLLGFSRMQANKQRPERQRRALAPIVESALSAFEQRTEEAAPVERALDSELEASVDAESIQMAIDNLLRNAHKHAPGGTPYRVELRPDGRGARISVSDHGPGIAKRDQRRIFRPFERADDRLSRATEGSGIGLSLVRYVATQHAGRAWVESSPGAGATFVIWIPTEETAA